MNYIKQYIKLIRKSLGRTRDDNYMERHHIFPTSIFGKNDSVVYLTPREHVLAHILLWKGMRSRYGSGDERTRKMCFALSMMGWVRKDGKKVSTRSVASARIGMSLYLTGDNNPAKTIESRTKISESKRGKTRNDMKGKSYFGASEENIAVGIEKMRIKKTGMKIDYPKQRNSPPCSEEKAMKIRDSRLETKNKFINMTEEEFRYWLNASNLYNRRGGRNANITRALQWRGIDVDEFYRSNGFGVVE